MKDMFDSIGTFWQGVLASIIAAILLGILYRIGGMFIVIIKESKIERQQKNQKLKDKLSSLDAISRIDGNFQILFQLLQYLFLAVISLVVSTIFEFVPLIYWILIVFSLLFFLIGLNDIFRVFKIIRHDSAFIKYSVITKFRINHAEYGANGVFIDVTDALNSLIKDNKIDIPVTNSIGGDPIPATPKKLIVIYSVNQESQKRIIPEGEIFTAP